MVHFEIVVNPLKATGHRTRSCRECIALRWQNEQKISLLRRRGNVCIIYVLNWSDLCPVLPFLHSDGYSQRSNETPSENCSLVCAGDILSLGGAFFFSRLSHTSPCLARSHSRYLMPGLSGSQWRCRRSSFGSTRLLANVPISEGRARTTNHRRRGRGERLWPRSSPLRLRVLSQPPPNGNMRSIRNFFFSSSFCGKKIYYIFKNLRYRDIFRSFKSSNSPSLVSWFSN